MDSISVYLLVRFDVADAEKDDAVETAYRRLGIGDWDDYILDHVEPEVREPWAA